jgi:hypothetical protein
MKAANAFLKRDELGDIGFCIALNRYVDGRRKAAPGEDPSDTLTALDIDEVDSQKIEHAFKTLLGIESKLPARCTTRFLGVTRIEDVSPNNMTPERAEALLTTIIEDCAVEIVGDDIDNEPAYDNRQEFELDCISDSERELCDIVGWKRVKRLIWDVHHSQSLSESSDYTLTFYRFNDQYFGGRLEFYSVRAVFDTDSWAGKSHNDQHRSHIDLANKEIILTISYSDTHSMESELLHLTAHIAVGTTADDDGGWLAEMERLRKLGAPVFKLDAGDSK